MVRAMSLYSALKGKGPSGFGYGSTASEVTQALDLGGKTILLTGCNSGLGEESMRALASRGARVIAAARTMDKAKAACATMSGDLVPVACELSEPESVRACVASVSAMGHRLDAILCNAGIMALPELHTQHGWELQFFTNHIGHFILVTGLLDQLADDGRVVMVSSGAHFNAPEEGIVFDNLDGSKGYKGWTFYGQSKLANLLFARELGRRFEGTGKRANALHPGVIATNLSRHMNPLARIGLALGKPLVLKSTPQGAATQVWAAVHPDAGAHNGEYLKDCNVGKSSRQGRDMDLAAKLWKKSEEIVASL